MYGSIGRFRQVAVPYGNSLTFLRKSKTHFVSKFVRDLTNRIIETAQIGFRSNTVSHLSRFRGFILSAHITCLTVKVGYKQFADSPM